MFPSGGDVQGASPQLELRLFLIVLDLSRDIIYPLAWLAGKSAFSSMNVRGFSNSIYVGISFDPQFSREIIIS
jgi:hypothetical protein